MIFSDTGGTCGGALQKLRIVSGKPRGVFVADRRRTEERCKMHARGKIRAGGRRVRHVGVIELDPRGIFVYIEKRTSDVRHRTAERRSRRIICGMKERVHRRSRPPVFGERVVSRFAPPRLVKHRHRLRLIFLQLFGDCTQSLRKAFGLRRGKDRLLLKYHTVVFHVSRKRRRHPPAGVLPVPL